MNNPQHGGLYLVLAADNSPAWEEECEDCHGSGEWFVSGTPPRNVIGRDGGYYVACETCGGDEDDPGTGTRKRRLVGAVDTDKLPTEIQLKQYKGADHAELAKAVIAAHRVGTLPPALYADPGDPADHRLREEDA